MNAAAFVLLGDSVVLRVVEVCWLGDSHGQARLAQGFGHVDFVLLRFFGALVRLLQSGRNKVWSLTLT